MSQPPPPASTASRREEEEESGDEGEQHGSQPEPRPELDPLAELFTLDSGVSCRFFLHHSLTAGMKAEATKKIEAHGGQTTMLENHAQIVLVSEARLTMPLRIMKLRYDISANPILRKIHVEPISFLNRCANMGFFKLGGEKKIKMGMPGPRPREEGYIYREKVRFTDEDDRHLCRYLSIVVPDKKAGGRTGNKIYQELEDLGRCFLHEYAWVTRHTWQSWRNRYNKNQELLDGRIAQWAMRRNQDGKGEYQRARKPQRGGRVPRGSDSEPLEPEGDEDDVDLPEEQGGGDEFWGDDGYEGGGEDGFASVRKKRRHVEAAVPNEKKKRITGPPDVEVATGGLAKGKGKGKATDREKQREEERRASPDPFEDYDMLEFDFGNDDINMQYNEPGPSNTQRSPSLVLPPSLTLVPQNQARPFRVRHVPTRGMTTMNSRAALVPTQHHTRTKPAGTHANPLQNLSNTTAVSKKQPVPSQNIGRGGAVRKTAPQRALNTAVMVTSTPAQEELPPFRITRARSRSLEPSVVAKTNDKGKGKGKETPVLRPVVENLAVGGDDDVPHLLLSQTGPTGETYEDAEAVDQLLSEASMEPEDDAQIRRTLQNIGQFEGEDNDDDDEDDELEKLLKARDAKAKTTSRSKPSATAASRPQTNVSPLAGSLAYNPPASTPVPAHRRRSTRATAVASVLDSNFPSPGTRARAIREQKEKEARSAPYEPPEGTRASAHRTRLFR